MYEIEKAQETGENSKFAYVGVIIFYNIPAEARLW